MAFICMFALLSTVSLMKSSVCAYHCTCISRVDNPLPTRLSPGSCVQDEAVLICDVGYVATTDLASTGLLLTQTE